LDEQTGFSFGVLDGGIALGLERLEIGHVLFDGVADALFVSCQELEITGLRDPGAALGESGVDFGVGGGPLGSFALARLAARYGGTLSGN
jgi:hypothetical protein